MASAVSFAPEQSTDLESMVAHRESVNEREFGAEGLRNSILKRRNLALEPLLNGVVEDARDFSGNGFMDDVCLLGMELEPVGAIYAAKVH